MVLAVRRGYDAFGTPGTIPCHTKHNLYSAIMSQDTKKQKRLCLRCTSGGRYEFGLIDLIENGTSKSILQAGRQDILLSTRKHRKLSCSSSAMSADARQNTLPKAIQKERWMVVVAEYKTA